MSQEDFKKVHGVTKFELFRFCKGTPGKVEMKHRHSSENVETLQLVKNANKVFAATDLSPVLPAIGIAEAHQKYLRDNCTTFCRHENQEAFGAVLE